MDWSVLPRPMSSQRMPCSWYLARNAIQLTPSSWYLRSSAFICTGSSYGCTLLPSSSWVRNSSSLCRRASSSGGKCGGSGSALTSGTILTRPANVLVARSRTLSSLSLMRPSTGTTIKIT